MMTALERELGEKAKNAMSTGARRSHHRGKALPEFALQTEYFYDFLINLRVRVELIQFGREAYSYFVGRRTFSHGVLSMRSSIVNPSSAVGGTSIVSTT